MNKNIKKSLKYFIIFIGIIVTLPTLLYLILRIPDVQTYIVQRITSHISNEIKSSISVGKVEYIFFNSISITDLLIKDLNQDTLLYSDRITVSLKKLDLEDKSYRLGKVLLHKPVISIITDTSGRMNLKWYLDLLKSPGDSTSKSGGTFIIDQAEIENARFSLINRNNTENNTPVNFNNLRFSNINGSVENLKIENDTTAFEIYNLGLTESSGLSIKKLSSYVTLAGGDILLNSFYMNTDSSILNLKNLEIYPDSITSFENFTKKVRIDIDFENSSINSSDLKYFVPFAKNMHETIQLSGRVYGTISELRGRNIELSYRDYTSLDCDFDFSGLPDIENTFIYIGVNRLVTIASDIEKIELPGKGRIRLPEAVYKLGNISFDGSFTGFTTDFVTYGKIATNLGNIRTDVSLRPEESDRFHIKGLITGSNIDLGQITGNTEMLGKLSMKANVDGFASSYKKFAANLTGNIDSVVINNYRYSDIDLKGYFTENTWDGSIKIDDENIKMDLLGMFDFSEDLPVFDFTLSVNKANLNRLNFDPKDTTSSISMLLTSNFRGNNIDNLDGEIRLLNSKIIKYGKDLDLKNFSIRTYSENSRPVISLRTDFADADLKGYYSFSGLGQLFKSTFSSLLPSLAGEAVTEEKKGRRTYDNEKNIVPERNDFDFTFDFKNTDKINEFFRTGLIFSEDSYLKGRVSSDSVITLKGESGKFNFRNNILNNLTVDITISGKDLVAGINTSSLTFMGQTELKDFSVDLETRPDNFIFSFDWDNKETDLNKGNFRAMGTVSKSEFSGNPVLDIIIDSSDIYVRNNLWRVKESEVVIDSNSVKIDNIFIVNDDHYYRIDGTISENLADTLHLNFSGIDISPLNYIGKKKEQTKEDHIPLNLRGRLNGKVLLTNIYKNLLLETNLKLEEFSMLNSEYGDISVVSAWDAQRRVVNIEASNNLNMFDIQGYYDPSSKRVNVGLVADKLPIGALNPLLKVFASNISGFVSGKVRLAGDFGHLTLNGAMLAEKASLKVDYLQTVFNLNDSVRFDNKGIRFNNARLTDEKGNNATITGYVYHTNFKKYSTDLVVNTNQFQVLNTKPKDNELFYGTAFATGVTTIKIDENTIGFDISARTDKNTKFYIPLTSGLSVSDYTFVKFIDSDSLVTKNNTSAPAEKKQTGMDLNFDLQVTPDAEVKLIFDAKVGDEMTGTGSGDLNVSLDKEGNFKISGDYIIEKGDYLFTLGNILNKSFKVENGGRITFNGDIDNAEIDMLATYRLTTSLYQILQEERYKERTDVDIQLNLTGKLFNPVVKLNIDLPNADEETKTYLKSMINTEEELNRQFFSLLVMNNFLATTNSTSGTTAMTVTTTEMLSNQISNWLSQLSNDVDLGVVYRPGNKEINSQELEVALSTQLLNDKVLLNFRGTGTSGTEASKTNQISGDFDAEVKITDKIRFKVFNRYNNPYTGKQADYTQGIGLFYRQEFSKFSDLFGKKKKNGVKQKAEMKKEEEPVVKK